MSEVYLNGRFVNQSEALLPIHDAGVVLGATVSDMARTFRHKLFCLEEHAVRFLQSASLARIECPLSIDELRDTAVTLVQRNCAQLAPENDLGLVMFLTAGPLSMYAGESLDAAPTICMHTFPLTTKWSRFFSDGIHAVVPATRAVPSECLSPEMKCRSRMHWHIASQEAREIDPLAIPLCLDLNGNISESAGANFLLTQGNQILSPPKERILQGVSLGVIRELATTLGYSFEYCDLKQDDVYLCDEAMMTSTPYCIAPVTRIDNQSVGSSQGRIFRSLLEAWSERVGVDIARQMTADHGHV